MRVLANNASAVRIFPALATTALFSLIFAFILRRHMVDDAYITFSYAANVAEHLHWGITRERTANTATSPLNVLALAGLMKVTPGDGILAVGVLYVVCVSATYLAIQEILRHLNLPVPAWWAIVITLLVELNPIMLSSVGLESAMFVAILAWLLVAAQARHSVWFGVLAGALILTRPDGVLFAAILSFALGRSIRRLFTAIAIALVPVCLWAVVSWILLGSLVPDTMFKTYQLPWGGYAFGTGLVLLGKYYPAAIAVSVALPLVCLLILVPMFVLSCLRNTRTQFAINREVVAIWLLIAAGCLHYGAYSVLHPPPFHWYYTMSFAPITLGAMILLAYYWGTTIKLKTFASALVITCFIMLLINVPGSFPPITTNWQDTADARAMAIDVKKIVGDADVRFVGELGALAFYCRCELVDGFSDMAERNDGIVRRIESSAGLTRTMLRLNFHHRDLAAARASTLYLMIPTKDPVGHRWSWSTTSPWAGTNFYVLDPL